MSRIFINYRREDAGMGVGRLTDALREHFADDQIFQDISSIAPGADFIEALQQALADCAAVLVVIGPKWLAVADRQGRRRLDDPDDWVRQEIVEALGRPGVRVFPLLLDGSEMPAATELPDAIKPLARRQAYELTLRHWAKDIAVLVETLKGIPSLATAAPQSDAGAAPVQGDEPGCQTGAGQPSPPETGRGENGGGAGWEIRKRLAVAGLVLVAGIGIWLATRSGDSKMPEPVAVEAAPKSAAPEPAPAKAPAASFAGEMVPLPAGCFDMGGQSGEEGHESDLRQHRVCVEAFAIGKTEVTQDQWLSVMGGDNPADFNCADCPVERVSWEDAMAFIAKLNISTGQRYRLPTEAEWEYACRGGRPGERYCGGNDLDSVGWVGSNSGRGTHAVGQKQTNAYGLYDMSGNVMEWTCSGYDGANTGGDRQCANNASKYVTRGGGRNSSPQGASSAFRLGFSPGIRLSDLGFRLARSLP